MKKKNTLNIIENRVKHNSTNDKIHPMKVVVVYTMNEICMIVKCDYGYVFEFGIWFYMLSMISEFLGETK